MVKNGGECFEIRILDERFETQDKIVQALLLKSIISNLTSN